MITLALIGLGRWGQNYVKTSRNIKELQIKYLCALSNKNLSKFGDEYIKTNNYYDLLKFDDIDGIIIASSASSHFQIARAFLLRKIPILVEKPMTNNLSDADKLMKVYNGVKSIFMVGHIFLYNSAFLKTIELSKNLGIIHNIEITDCSSGPFRDDVTPLWDWGPHSVSMTLELSKSLPVKVSAWMVDNYGLVLARLVYKSGLIIFIKAGSICKVKTRQLIINGERGVVKFDDLASYHKVSKFSKGNKPFYPTYLRKEQPLRNQLIDFISCIKDQKQPKTDLRHGYQTIRILDRVERSIRENREIVI